MVRRFLLLNGIAILGVILFHSAGWGFVALFSWADRYGAVPAEQIGSGSYYFLRLIEQLVVFSIPAFLFVSGFFIAFATGQKKTLGWRMVGIRIRDLFIPYLIWSLLLITLAALEGRFHTPLKYMGMLLTGGANPAYYYVILMIQFYLLAPFLVRWAKANALSLLLVTAVMQIFVQAQYYPALLGWGTPETQRFFDVLPKWLFVVRIFWFSLGIVVGFNIKPVQTWVVRYKRPLLALALLLIPVGFAEWEIMRSLSGRVELAHRETFLDSVYSLAVIFAFLGYYQVKIPYTRTLDDLGSKSFGIYLAHSPVMEYTARAVAVLAPALLAYQWFILSLMFVVGLGVPMMMMTAVNRIPIRRYYKYLFG